jgi:hypothetical protein
MVELRDIELLGRSPPLPGAPDDSRYWSNHPLLGQGALALRRSRISH